MYSFFSATGPRWWLRGRMTEGLANNIIALIQDMATVSSIFSTAFLSQNPFQFQLLKVMGLCEHYFLARLDEVQEELLYYRASALAKC